jgi:hypothetical protein
MGTAHLIVFVFTVIAYLRQCVERHVSQTGSVANRWNFPFEASLAHFGEGKILICSSQWQLVVG